MPLLGNFAAQSNNNKKRDLPASPVLCLSRLFNVVYLSTCSSIFACSKIDNNLVIVDLFDRCQRASNDDGRASSGRCVKRHLHVHRKFSPDRTKRKTEASPMRRETTFWCLLMLCHWFLQTRTGGISKSKWAYKGTVNPWACRRHRSISWI